MLYLFLIAGALAVLSVIIHIVNFRKQKELSFGRYTLSVLSGEGSISGKREGAYDWLRFLATILVLLVHAASDAETRQSGAGNFGAGWWITVAVIAVAFCCNFLFIELSGALMLRPKDESALLFYAKRFIKVVIPLLFYYALYMFLYKKLNFSIASMANFLREFSGGINESTGHLWVVFIILGCYLGTPLLRLATRAISEKQKRETLGIILVLFALSFLARLTGWFEIGVTSYLLDCTAIYLAGYLILNTDLKKAEPFIYGAGALALIAAVVLVWVTRYESIYVSIYSPFIFLASLALMLFVKRKTERPAPGIIRLIGNYSFSILMIHWVVMFTLLREKLGLTLWLENAITPVPTIFVISALSLVIGVVAAVVVDKFILFPITYGLERLLKRAGRREGRK